ncbi:copper fist DNA binding domain-containing protein [Hirsutella rhossiliensis]|uniref:Copper fist DNA binding domain-containing protein n=1 Tax=Hirsutella rhossiliensis TaxID=111463 RepID=A0A9P8SHI9_9HYPO|nr:copper fist DNA binding domain-containing protein [Hirsutella rhossiliensis]KAH0961580.1 copper fist DNA binding domain-containing protein [Hirsutella rhossiliensis]
MLIDGEKYACEACVRGHRVSNCQHSDRPLQHINKKGRPVSQCQHCRNMRKSRSAHIKCDCGEKTSKCAHLQQPVEGHKETCCCNHGGRCTCCHKKEPSLDTVPESDSDGETPSLAMPTRPKAAARRRRANTVHSDGVLSFDQNGHHKPTAKHNRAAQKCGPYQLNRVNSATSTSSLGASSESLFYQAGSEGQSLGGRSRAATAHEQRRVKSETASPLMTGSAFPQLNGALPPLDLSRIEYPASYVGNGTFEMFGSGLTSEHEAPMYSAGLSAASVDWSHYDLGESKGDFAPSSYSQAGAQSFSGLFDFGSGSEQLPRLANTTSTSGDVSEVEDLMGNGDGDFDGFSAGSNGFLRQGNLVGNSTDLSGIDYDSFYQKNSEGTSLPATTISMVEEDAAFWVPNYNEGIATMDESPDPLGTSSLGNFWEV